MQKEGEEKVDVLSLGNPTFKQYYPEILLYLRSFLG
jgi:hypothetical protein